MKFLKQIGFIMFLVGFWGNSYAQDYLQNCTDETEFVLKYLGEYLYRVSDCSKDIHNLMFSTQQERDYLQQRIAVLDQMSIAEAETLLAEISSACDYLKLIDKKIDQWLTYVFHSRGDCNIEPEVLGQLDEELEQVKCKLANIRGLLSEAQWRYHEIPANAIPANAIAGNNIPFPVAVFSRSISPMG